ncbi:hypothetical protein Tdes44962_MAKER06050 [Teratosphaeria destructans]|uniref:Uncharacterized protein n=1 Tax=Teratosphaeria destructans TaxID=418781 RepID=A0A9W7VY06_9PEZI|nr:hypothetical protein Tdes44962_MAKER06050 [Teratosphaeria destructans]
MHPFEDGSTPRNQPRSSELYQSGFNPYITGHDVQLRYVLVCWRDMVRDGKWAVGVDEVMGGIEKWEEADAEGTWADYVLPQTLVSVRPPVGRDCFYDPQSGMRRPPVRSKPTDGRPRLSSVLRLLSLDW